MRHALIRKADHSIAAHRAAPVCLLLRPNTIPRAHHPASERVLLSDKRR